LSLGRRAAGEAEGARWRTVRDEVHGPVAEDAVAVDQDERRGVRFR
jgi:hypothetical protein